MKILINQIQPPANMGELKGLKLARERNAGLSAKIENSVEVRLCVQKRCVWVYIFTARTFCPSGEYNETFNNRNCSDLNFFLVLKVF